MKHLTLGRIVHDHNMSMAEFHGHPHPLEDELNLVTIILSIIIAPITAAGNFAVLLIIYYIKDLHTPHYIITAAIALIDMLVGMVWIPIDVIADIEHTQHLILGSKLGCQMHFLCSICLDVTLTFIVYMSFDRCAAINHPMWYNQHITKSNTIWTLIILFILQFIGYVALALNCVYFQIYKDGTIITDLADKCSDDSIPYWFSDSVWNYTIIGRIVLAFALDARVMRTALEQVRKIRFTRDSVESRVSAATEKSKDAESTARYEREKLTVRMTFVLTFAHLLWLPSAFSKEIEKNASEDFWPVWDVFATIFRTVNGLVDVIVLNVMKRSFWICFKLIFTTSPLKWRWLKDDVRAAYHNYVYHEEMMAALQQAKAYEDLQNKRKTMANSQTGLKHNLEGDTRRKPVASADNASTGVDPGSTSFQDTTKVGKPTEKQN